MQSFSSLTSAIVPLPLKDIDTDLIIPAEYLTSTSAEGYGDALFSRLRKQDPDFVLNQEKYSGAKILVTRSNFGCGSSREHAVWALLEYGFRTVIAPSFSDIFFSNAGKNGLVLVQLPEESIERMLDHALYARQRHASTREPMVDASRGGASDGLYHITVDLERQVVMLPDDTEEHFDFDPFRKECILKGYDDLKYIQSHADTISSWKQEREEELFYSTLQRNR